MSVYCHNKYMEDDDDNTVLADILSLKISKENKRNSVTNWSKQRSPWLYQNKDKRQEQLQASLNQLQYLHQQQLKTMMRYSSYKNNDYNKNSNNSNRSSNSSSNNSNISSSNSSNSSSSSSSSSSKRNSYTFQLSPSSSNSSFQSQKRYSSSFSKKIKRAFSVTRSMSEKKPNQDIILPDSPTSSVSSRKTNRLTKYFSLLPLPASSTACSKVSFSSTVIVHETFSSAEYDRQSDNTYTCQNLTPELALDIKKELNDHKLNNMHVHPQSRQFTHFFI
ncbi:unnamed protein product [Rhizopus microsporus]